MVQIQTTLLPNRVNLYWPTRFYEPEDAARIWDVMAVYLRGPDAELNFDGEPPFTHSKIDVLNQLLAWGLDPKDLYGL